MRRLRNVKIVATLGPASQSYDMIRALHEAGADVFRLNMSHGTHAEIAERHKIIRKVEDDLSSPIAILADLQGPKLRVGEFASGAEDLVEGDRFRVDLDPAAGDKTRVQLPHEEIFSALKPGAHLLVNDGKIKLKVEECWRRFCRLSGVERWDDFKPQGRECAGCGFAFGSFVRKRSRRFRFRLRFGRGLVGLVFCAAPGRFNRGA